MDDIDDLKKWWKRMDDGEWHHFHKIVVNGKTSLYIDGVEV